MLETVSEEIRLKVLLKIVRNAIRHSRNAEIFRLQEILKEEREGVFEIPVVLTREEVKKKIKEQVRAKLSGRPIGIELKKEHFELSRVSRNNPKKFVPRKEPALVVPTLESISPKRKKVHPVRRGPPPRIVSPSRIAPPQRRVVPTFKRRVLRIPEHKLPPRLSNIKPVPTNEQIDLGSLNVFVNDRNVKTLEVAGEGQKVVVTGTMGRMPTAVTLTKDEINAIINKFSLASKIPVSNGLFKVAVGRLILIATISENVTPGFVIQKIA